MRVGEKCCAGGYIEKLGRVCFCMICAHGHRQMCCVVVGEKGLCMVLLVKCVVQVVYKNVGQGMLLRDLRTWSTPNVLLAKGVALEVTFERLCK